jgi:hypothetical protein
MHNKETKFPKGNYPCKVVAILPKQHNSFLGETEVIVQCAGSKTNKDSVPFEEWTLMDGYYTVLDAASLEFYLFWSLGVTKLQLHHHIQSGHHVLLIHPLIDDICINNEYIKML